MGLAAEEGVEHAAQLGCRWRGKAGAGKEVLWVKQSMLCFYVCWQVGQKMLCLDPLKGGMPEQNPVVHERCCSSNATFRWSELQVVLV